jgi:hypothetical protein
LRRSFLARRRSTGDAAACDVAQENRRATLD